MEEIFIKACRNKNKQYIKDMMNMYIEIINDIETQQNIENTWIHRNDDIMINLIIDIINSTCIKLVINNNAFINAINCRDVEVIKCLLENKAQYNEVKIPDIYDIIELSCEKNSSEIVKYILHYYEKTDTKINIHRDDDFTFMVACEQKQLDIMRYIIEYSEKINERFELNYRNYFWITRSYGRDYYDNKALRYIYFLRKHNYDTGTHEIHSCCDLFNYKYIYNYSTEYNCVFNNIMDCVNKNQSVPFNYINYCLFIKTNK